MCIKERFSVLTEGTKGVGKAIFAQDSFTVSSWKPWQHFCHESRVRRAES